MSYTKEQKSKIAMENKIKQDIKYLTNLRDYMKKAAARGEIIDAKGEFIRIETFINFGAGMQNCNPGLIQEAKNLIEEIHELTDKKKDRIWGRERRVTAFRYIVGDFSRGKFEEFGIVTQEQFDDFISRIPEQYRDAKKKAIKNWNMYMECQKLPIEEIELRLDEEEKELEYLNTYYKIVEKGVKCDFDKLKREVSVDRLEWLIEELDKGSAFDYNSRSKVKNSVFQPLLIDKEDESAWEIQEKYRVERLRRIIYEQDAKVNMLESIINNRQMSEEIEQSQTDSEYIFPDIKRIGNDSTMLQRARLIRKWMQDKNTTTPPSHMSSDKVESKLGGALGRIRMKLIVPYKEAKAKGEGEEELFIKYLETRVHGKVQENELKEILQIVEEIDRNNLPQMLINARNIKKWMISNNSTKLPQCNSNDEDERKLADALYKIRNVIVKPYKEAENEEEKLKIFTELENRDQQKITKEQVEEILQIMQEVDSMVVPKLLQNARDIRKWMDLRETKIPPRAESKEEEERILGEAFRQLKSRIIYPYQRLQTEQERKQYIKKLEERKHDIITEQQFKEILQTVEEIEENNPRRKRTATDIGMAAYSATAQDCGKAEYIVGRLAKENIQEINQT